MFKRARWAAVGYAAGIGTTVYAAYKTKQAARRYTPPEIAQRAAGAAARGGTRVRDAVVEGRAAMTEREAELRLQYDAGRGRPTTPRADRGSR